METIFNLVESRGAVVTVLLLVGFLSWESVWPFFGFFRGHWKDRSTHALRNLCMGLINSVMISLVFIAAWLWAAEWAFAHSFGLLYVWELPVGVQALGGVLILDVWTYWFHRMSHRIPFLWRFHQVHHSDREMDVTTASRFHVGEILISSVLRIGIILLGGVQLWHVALYELIMFPIVQFHHANIGVGPCADKWLRRFIVTPSMHKVHHSDRQVETDSNYTSLLSVWDRLFGSFRIREDEENIQFGLDSVDKKQSGRLLGMLKNPFDRK